MTTWIFTPACLAAFSCFDDYCWAWAYDPDAESGPAYLIRSAPPGARGSVEILMPGATHEQAEAVRAWLIAQYSPRYELPATWHLIALGERSASSNPAWSHLMV